MTDLTLLPAPRRLTSGEGVYPLESGKRIALTGASAADLLFSAQRLQNALASLAAVEWTLAATASGPASETGALLAVDTQQVLNPQGYELTISSQQISVIAHDPAGIFYGVCTLVQIIEQSVADGSGSLPCLHISDYPDFPARGVMLDISRDKVPTMETLLALVDMLAGWKINQLQLYTEHTFAYRNHPDVWAAASPLTEQEILAAGCLLPRALYRAGAQPELVRPHASLAQAPRPITALAEVPCLRRKTLVGAPARSACARSIPAASI